MKVIEYYIEKEVIPSEPSSLTLNQMPSLLINNIAILLCVVQGTI